MSYDPSHFVTDLQSDVFALKNLPEVVKGALFSKYSRSTLGLRRLLEREFLQDPSTVDAKDAAPLQRAQDFYDRILDGYGDDSIGELGGAHLALENVSMIGAKIIEDRRIGGSPLEKSTRYVPFDKKRNGRYAYYRDPTIMASPLAGQFEGVCDRLFETYTELFPPLLNYVRSVVPKGDEEDQRANDAALRARAFDSLRGLLPAATLTNVGLFGNGRYFEGLLQKLRMHPLHEMRVLGAQGFDQLARLIPSFIRRAREDHPHLRARARYAQDLHGRLQRFASEHLSAPRDEAPTASTGENRVDLINFDPSARNAVAAALLFSHSEHTLGTLEKKVRSWSEEQFNELFGLASAGRGNRRHKSPRALERAHFTFDLVADFGCYRDLQRHRTLSQERQVLTSQLGYRVPEDVLAAGLEAPYRRAMDAAGALSAQISTWSPEAAQYAVPMGYRLRWYFHINLRALQWLCELRSAPAGHPAYRAIAQQMCTAVTRAVPSFSPFFEFVDFDDGKLGRLGQEQRRIKRENALSST